MRRSLSLRGSSRRRASSPPLLAIVCTRRHGGRRPISDIKQLSEGRGHEVQVGEERIVWPTLAPNLPRRIGNLAKAERTTLAVGTIG